jgi:hypothetical protein
MKIKTNVRAGKGGSTATTKTKSKDSSKINNTVVSYVPPVSRCVGI